MAEHFLLSVAAVPPQRQVEELSPPLWDLQGLKQFLSGPGAVAHACNPSTLGG